MFPWDGSRLYVILLEKGVLEGSRMLHNRHISYRSLTNVICAGLLVSASSCGWSLSTTHAQTTIQFGGTPTVINSPKHKVNSAESGFRFRSVPPIKTESKQELAPLTNTSKRPLVVDPSDFLPNDFEISGWEVPNTGKPKASSNRLANTPQLPSSAPATIESMAKGKPGDDSFRILKGNKLTPTDHSSRLLKEEMQNPAAMVPVSYTHLTLPTIYSV